MIERVALTTAGVRDRWLRPRLAPASDRAAAAARLASETWALPLLLTLAVAAGIGFVSAITPIGGRGDFGQWLMTSRYYLGQGVPSYRVVTDLPPLVPALLAVIRIGIQDPAIALQTLNILVLLGLALSFFAVGAVLLDDPIGGLLSAVVAFLVTDRFLELAAFGGLLQSVSILFINLAVAAFARAGTAGERSTRWWTLGSGSLALAALAHVGTAIIGIPIGISVAVFFLVQKRRLGWRRIASFAWPSVVVLAALALYLWVVLLPAGRDYVTNPASLGYRGPGRLLSGLFSYWPTTVVMLVGGTAIVLGVVGELFRRAPGLHVALLSWAVVAWGALLYASVTGASTDYPRFATLVLAPLVIGAAGALTWLAQSLRSYLGEVAGLGGSPVVIAIGAAALILVMAPFAVVRYQTQMSVYGSRDPDSLSGAVRYLDQALGRDHGAVLTSVRDGKWFEGVTGREAQCRCRGHPAHQRGPHQRVLLCEVHLNIDIEHRQRAARLAHRREPRRGVCRPAPDSGIGYQDHHLRLGRLGRGGRPKERHDEGLRPGSEHSHDLESCRGSSHRLLLPDRYAVEKRIDPGHHGKRARESPADPAPPGWRHGIHLRSRDRSGGRRLLHADW
ncbi:MAG: hypothetical protein E6J39_08950 [Chloroflexi bacterium]|nr:MAG: hypothetical protein E6J39_08950 [Chloroflexota bacterium]